MLSRGDRGGRGRDAFLRHDRRKRLDRDALSCPTCHSIVYGTAEVMPGLLNIYAGSLDDTSQFKPQMAIFTRSRPAWDDSSRNLQCFETVPQRES